MRHSFYGVFIVYSFCTLHCTYLRFYVLSKFKMKEKGNNSKTYFDFFFVDTLDITGYRIKKYIPWVLVGQRT